MRLFGPRCAVLLLVRGVSSVQPAHLLSSRLQRLLSLVPADCPSVADIGCDHALVARTLCRERLTERVFAVDRSEAALTAALDECAGPLGHGRQPTFVLGDGLSPLLKEGTVNTLICAGMGCQSTIQILDAEAMSTLSVQRLVLQPWPSYLLPHSTLFKHVLRLGFDFDTQFIDFENSVHYITTSFTRTASQDVSNSVSEIDVFRRTPLFKRYQTDWAKGGPCEREIQLWKQYLTLQLEDLKMRLRQSPLSVRYDVVEEYHSELTAILKVL
jgi:tRNA (adenine22-N1)-methyltransferase